MSQFESKHGIVSRQPYEIYMSFSDMSNFLRFLPEDKKQDIVADYDTLTASIQGIRIGVKVHERVPYSRIELVDNDAPFGFHVVLYFDPAAENPYKTDFHIMFEADLNFMMKMLIGPRIKDAMDKIVDGLVDASEGRMPEGFDPSAFGGGQDA